MQPFQLDQKSKLSIRWKAKMPKPTYSSVVKHDVDFVSSKKVNLAYRKVFKILMLMSN